MRPAILALLLVLLSGQCYAAADGAFRLNLLQVRHTISLDRETQSRIRADFANHSPGALSPDLAQVLVDALPTDFRRSCPSMIEPWGDIATGTARLEVRVLHSEQATAWLAYRCSSSRAEYKNSYDERIALLDTTLGTLDLFPFDQDFSNDSMLYHIEYKGPIPVDHGSGSAFTIHASDNNPCCDGPTAISGEQLRIFLPGPTPHLGLSLKVEKTGERSRRCRWRHRNALPRHAFVSARRGWTGPCIASHVL